MFKKPSHPCLQAQHLNSPKKTSRDVSRRRDSATILDRMRAQAVIEGQGLPFSSHEENRTIARGDPADIGLILGQLEGRWSVSSSLVRPFLEQAGLPYEGRRAGMIYRWSTIFKAEGISEKIAMHATRSSHPDLFEDLLDTKAAAAFLGYRDSSSVRKLIAEGDIPAGTFITFGSREVYRIRLSALRSLRKALGGRIV